MDSECESQRKRDHCASVVRESNRSGRQRRTTIEHSLHSSKASERQKNNETECIFFQIPSNIHFCLAFGLSNPPNSSSRLCGSWLVRMSAAFHLEPLDFSLSDLGALSSEELSLVLFHPQATDDLSSKVFRLFSRQRELARLAGEPLPSLAFPLDNLTELDSNQLALVASGFHTFAEQPDQDQAEKLWFKRRNRDFATGAPNEAATVARLPTPPVVVQIPSYPSADDSLPPEANKLLFTLRLSNLPVNIVLDPSILLTFLPHPANTLLAAVVDPPTPQDADFSRSAFITFPDAESRTAAFQSIVGLIIHRFDVGVDFVESNEAQFKWSDFSDAIGKRLYRASHGLPELEVAQEVVKMSAVDAVAEPVRTEVVSKLTGPEIIVNSAPPIFVPPHIVDRFFQIAIKFSTVLPPAFKVESGREQYLLKVASSALGYQRKGQYAYLAFATSPDQVAAITALRRVGSTGKFSFTHGKKDSWKWSDMLVEATKRKASSEIDGERRAKEARGSRSRWSWTSDWSNGESGSSCHSCSSPPRPPYPAQPRLPPPAPPPPHHRPPIRKSSLRSPRSRSRYPHPPRLHSIQPSTTQDESCPQAGHEISRRVPPLENVIIGIRSESSPPGRVLAISVRMGVVRSR